ncbi:hypothetical protein BOX15_Mlig032423g2, partial [Macrostomum lignano]
KMIELPDELMQHIPADEGQGGSSMHIQLGSSSGDEVIELPAEVIQQIQAQAAGGPVQIQLTTSNNETFELSSEVIEQIQAQADGGPIQIQLTSGGAEEAEEAGGAVQAYSQDARRSRGGQQGKDQLVYQCNYCPSDFTNAGAFTKHLRERHLLKAFVCRQCDKYFANLSDLFLHARRIHVDAKKPKRNPKDFRYHCRQCTYMTNNGGTFDAHLRAHRGEKPFKCDKCPKRFTQRSNMLQHRRMHFPNMDRAFKCEICNKSFTTFDILVAHLRTREHELRENYSQLGSSSVHLECNGCSVTFDSIYTLKKHTRSCPTVRSLQAKFRCVTCNCYINELSDLKSHVKAHSSITLISCPICGEKGFPGFNQLNHHITRAHALRVSKRHVCRYCMASFESKEEKEAHKAEVHKEELAIRGCHDGPFSCKYQNCDFVTNSKPDLVKHHAVHSQNRDPVNHTLIKAPPKSTRKPKMIKTFEEAMSKIRREREGYTDEADNEDRFKNGKAAVMEGPDDGGLGLSAMGQSAYEALKRVQEAERRLNKKPRGRPRKNPLEPPSVQAGQKTSTGRPIGRPRMVRTGTAEAGRQRVFEYKEEEYIAGDGNYVRPNPDTIYEEVDNAELVEDFEDDYDPRTSYTSSGRRRKAPAWQRDYFSLGLADSDEEAAAQREEEEEYAAELEDGINIVLLQPSDRVIGTAAPGFQQAAASDAGAQDNLIVEA